MRHYKTHRGLRKPLSHLHPRHHPLHLAPKHSNIPTNYMRLKERIARSNVRHCSTNNLPFPHLHQQKMMLTAAAVPNECPRIYRSSVVPTLPGHTYRIPSSIFKSRGSNASVSTGSFSISGSESTSMGSSNSNSWTSSPCSSPSSPSSPMSTSSSSLDTVTSAADATDVVDSATTTTTLDPRQHHELMLLKREAFQELASQTQRFEDLFVAKMIIWESLGPEEKAQWLERGFNGHSTATNVADGESMNDGSRTMEEDQDAMMDDLVNKLECRATCKDYSALIAFERQAEMERRQRQLEAEQTALASKQTNGRSV